MTGTAIWMNRRWWFSISITLSPNLTSLTVIAPLNKHETEEQRCKRLSHPAFACDHTPFASISH